MVPPETQDDADEVGTDWTLVNPAGAEGAVEGDETVGSSSSSTKAWNRRRDASDIVQRTDVLTLGRGI